MTDVVLIVVMVWIGVCCLIAPFAIALLRVAAVADEREDALRSEEALRRQAVLDRLERLRSPTGRRFFTRTNERQSFEEALCDVGAVVRAGGTSRPPS